MPSSSRKPKAIILVTLDALRADHLGCYGYPLPTTPFLDDLASKSILFDYAFSPVPFTAPSLTSLFTGRYPKFHSTGFYNGDRSLNKEEEVTLPMILRELGYTTAAFVSIINLHRATGLDLGFDYYDDNLTETQLKVPELRRSTEGTTRSAYSTTAAMLNWISEHLTSPFFLWVHYVEPHGPYIPPPPYNSLFVGSQIYGPPRFLEVVGDFQSGGIPAYQVLKARYDVGGDLLDCERDFTYYLSQYDGNIRFVDDQLSTVVENLKQWDIYDEALLIVTADHGEAMGENDMFFFHSMTVTLDQIRIPLVIKLPEYCKARPHTINEPVSTIDIMPTVLAICNDEANYLGLQGLNLLPYITGRSGSPHPQRYVFSEIPSQLSTIRGRFQLLYGKEPADIPYFRVPAVDGVKLFDYIADPAGKCDLSDERSDITKTLKTIAERYLRMPQPAYIREELSESDREDVKRRLKQLGYIHEDLQGGNPMLEWTGERFLPWNWDYGAPSHYEHLHRYAFAAHFVKGKKVLDLACGEGYGTYMLAREAEYVAGVEIDKTTVQHARSRYIKDNLEFIEGSIFAVPIEGEKKFDVAVCFEGIEHIAEHDKLLSEVKRLLKDNGLLIVSTPDKALIAQHQNPFHLKELYFDEFKALIRRYFKDVRFFGQKVYTGSNIWHIPSQGSSGYEEFVVEEGERDFHFVRRESRKPLTFIALASDGDLEPYITTVNTSWLVDVSDTSFREYKGQISNLEASLQEKVSQISSLEASLREKAELEATLSIIYHSRGWILLSACRNLVDRFLPPETRRRRMAGRIFNKLWGLLPISREKPAKKQGHSLYTRASNLIARTFDYYRKHGLRKTISIIYIELTRKKVTNNIIRLYSPEFYAPLTSRTAATKVKKVSFLIGCLEGESKRYRVYNIIEGLTGKGIECRVFRDINVGKLEQAVDCDLLILFRAAMSPNLDAIIDRFKQLDIPVVFDIDDLVFEPESVCYVYEIQKWSEDQKAEYMNGVNRYRQTLEKCDFATCTTEFLANRIRSMGKKCFVIPSTINKAQYELAEATCKKPSKKDKKIRIGYLSGTSTHDRDFLEAAEALVEILQRYKNTELHIIGPLRLPEEMSKFGHRIIRKPFMPYLEMLKYLAQMDINIAPLEQDNPYTAGKSELKIFEPALVSVPTIASRVDSYSKCISDGKNGFLAASREEWVEKLALLVENEELRANMGITAKHDFVDRFYIENVIDDVLKVYEKIVDTHHKRSIDLNHIDIAWIIPEPFAGSGGHRNIFRATKKLSEYGHKLTLYFTGYASLGEIKRVVSNHFYDLRHIKFVKYEGGLGWHDLCFATHWTTVYPMMQHKDKIRYPFYFVQDYEPMFLPMGSDYILAENTYRMGLTCITSGPWPTKILKNKFNAEADFFRFPVDKSVYNTDIKRTKTNRNIIFFARPEMPRRCYELGIMALKLAKERLPDVEIILFGADRVDSKSVPFEHTNLGLIQDTKDLAKLYRNADLGIAFSTTNPSLVPYEMMACSLAVADMGLEDSVVNYGSEENVYLLNPVPEIMAQELVEIMNNDEERQRRAWNGYNYVQSFPDEEGMCRRIEELIKRKIACDSRENQS